MKIVEHFFLSTEILVAIFYLCYENFSIEKKIGKVISASSAWF